MKFLPYGLVFLFLTACSQPDSLPEPVVEAPVTGGPVIVEESMSYRDLCFSGGPGAEDGIGGTGCSED